MSQKPIEVTKSMPSSDLIELLVNRSKPAKIFIKMASARPFLNEAELAIADYILAFPRKPPGAQLNN